MNTLYRAICQKNGDQFIIAKTDTAAAPIAAAQKDYDHLSKYDKGRFEALFVAGWNYTGEKSVAVEDLDNDYHDPDYYTDILESLKEKE